MLFNVFTWMANYIILSNSILSYVSITLVKDKKYLLHKYFLFCNIIKQGLVSTILYKYNIVR